jgi:DNA-binding MarR family transcriptional regulator
MSRLTTDDFDALANFRYLLRRFLRFSKEFLKANGNLSPEQYEALLAIKAVASSGGVTISQLSERLQVKHHSAVSIVDRLAERKLITRERGQTDRRHRHVKLTAKGEQLIEKLATVHRREMHARTPEIINALERLRE